MTVPQVIGTPRLSYQQFATSMADGGRVATTEVLANFARLERALTQALATGNRVETPIGSFSISLGVGERDDAGGFQVRGANARVNFRPARSLLAKVREQITFDVEDEVTVRRPIPERLENSASGVQLYAVHPMELVYVLGKNLDFDYENEEEGVLFVNGKGKATRCTSYGRSNAGQLAFVIPSLPAGTYTIEVRAKRDEDKPVEIGTLPVSITLELPGSSGSAE